MAHERFLTHLHDIIARDQRDRARRDPDHVGPLPTASCGCTYCHANADAPRPQDWELVLARLIRNAYTELDHLHHANQSLAERVATLEALAPTLPEPRDPR